MRSLALHNLKGGVGKTTTAVNLAWLAAQRGYRTLLWDLDAQGATSLYVRVRTGVEGGARKMLKAKDLQRAVVTTPFERLHVLPADFSLREVDLELARAGKVKKRVARVLSELAPRYDLVVLDAPPGHGLLAESVFSAVDLLLVPLIPSPLSLHAFKRMRHYSLRQGYASVQHAAPFFNMVDRRRKVHREFVESYMGNDAFLKTVVPYSADVERMGVHRAPLGTFAARRASGKAFESLWDEVQVRLQMPALVTHVAATAAVSRV